MTYEYLVRVQDSVDSTKMVENNFSVTFADACDDGLLAYFVDSDTYLGGGQVASHTDASNPMKIVRGHTIEFVYEQALTSLTVETCSISYQFSETWIGLSALTPDTTIDVSATPTEPAVDTGSLTMTVSMYNRGLVEVQSV